ncbi:DUF4436 domain-containing protein [Mycobacterium asiaticum]|uniref:DUF4436 domain-containing protein n=1 Tax=Mycobacterium asiaticum TaxID=1790 RepID=A0A1A3HTX5_MYCAS|nr:DUF4436 domain-containing protein [Mycobacterium asiaticum]OBI94561.1 DUF4436 domain-containing protein [Mycobacterium asiaticum]OBJ51119.1 DUF4436 domain-containing protein [Mycobacterium asiaticum]OBJ83770.1 DUF4436 domain-containing protein [Mycobacterium asiaticum]ORA17935.1 DUF4436 domain-containing protein [Mycobacterium asiaticum DSM 44297]
MSHQAPPPAPPAPPQSQPAGPPKQPSRARRLLVDLGVVLAVVAVYVISLVGVHLLASSGESLPEPDLGTTDDTVVQVKVEELDTVNNRLKVSVLVIPEDSKFDKKFHTLTQDLAVRMYPENDLGDLQYPVGKSPAQVSTYLDAQGDPANWPFDSYSTGTIQAQVFAGTGDNRTVEDARVEVIGEVGGWDVSVRRVGESTQSSPRPDDVIITLHRSKSTLIFDLGIVLVLISLPALALWVSIPMVLGKKKFLPPFVSWFAAMLFAVVPLRNIFPGKPPEGSWVDQAITLWVLLALIVAMTLFIVAYRKQSD